MTLRQQAGPSETIVWEGKKDTRVSIFEAIFNPMLPFALIWLIFDLTIILTFLSSESNTADESSGMLNSELVVFFALHLMPVWIYIVGIITSGLKSKNTEYLITDRGIYIKTGIFTTTTEMKPFAEISHVGVRQGIFDKIFGTGDVISACIHTPIADSNGSYSAIRTTAERIHGTNIENIADYERDEKI